MESYIIFALIGMFLFGINGILYKIAPNIDAGSLTFFSFISSAVAGTLLWFFLIPDKKLSSSGIAVALLAGVVAVSATFFLIKALQLGKASIVLPIRSLSAAVTVLLAILFLTEKLTWLKAAGVLLAIIATFILAL